MVNTLLELASAYQSIDLLKAEEYAQKGIEHADKLKFIRGKCLGLIRMGSIEVYKGNYLKALDFFNASNKLAEELDFIKGIEAFNYGMYQVYYFQSRYPEALTYLVKCIKIAEQVNDSKQLALCYSSVGSMFNIQGNYSDAINNFEKARDLYEKSGDHIAENRTIVNIGNVYLGMGKYDESLKFFFEALEHYGEPANNNEIAYAGSLIAQAYFYLGKLDMAEQNAKKALVIYHYQGNKNGIANCYNTLGKIELKRKNFDSANLYLTTSIGLSKEIGRLNSIKNNYLDLSILDSLRGYFRGAYENYKLFYAYHDSIFNQENTQNLTQQKMQFLFEKKQVADSIAVENEKQVEKLKLEKQRAMTYGGFGASVITIVLLFFVYINFKKQQKANKELKETQQQLIMSEKMAAFGIMASRVSHEIQNPLNFVNNFSEVSKDLVKEVLISVNEKDRKECADLLIENLTKIHEHGSRAASIVRQLQEHSNRGTAHDFFEPDTN